MLLLLPQTKTCFLAGPTGPQSEALRRQLQAKQVVCLSVERTFPSVPNATSIRSILNRSDFVGCILPLNPPANLLFELGMAIGLNKPLLLFADDPQQVPFDLASSRALKSDLISSEALDTFLEAFLKTIAPSPAKRRISPSRKSSHSDFWRKIRSEVSNIPSLPPRSSWPSSR